MINLGQKLLKEAQRVIPGGNQLLSKRKRTKTQIKMKETANIYSTKTQ